MGGLGGGPAGLHLHQRDSLVSRPFDFLGHAKQLDEDPHFGAHDVRHDGREEIVHGTQGIALRLVDFIGVGGNENDRRQGGLFALANISGRLVAVHVRHVDVEEDHREVMLQDELQRVGARPGGDDVFVELFQDRAQNQEVLGKIVDD